VGNGPYDRGGDRALPRPLPRGRASNKESLLFLMALPPQLFRHRGPRYTPIATRHGQDRCDRFSLLKTYPERQRLSEISKLCGNDQAYDAAVATAGHGSSSTAFPAPSRRPRGCDTFESSIMAITAGSGVRVGDVAVPGPRARARQQER